MSCEKRPEKKLKAIGTYCALLSACMWMNMNNLAVQKALSPLDSLTGYIKNLTFLLLCNPSHPQLLCNSSFVRSALRLCLQKASIVAFSFRRLPDDSVLHTIPSRKSFKANKSITSTMPRGVFIFARQFIPLSSIMF